MSAVRWRWGGVVVVWWLTGGFGVAGFVPAAVGGQIGGAVEDLVAFGAAVLDVNDARAAVLGQSEGVVKQLTAQTARVLPDAVLDFSLFDVCNSFTQLFCNSFLLISL